MAIEALVLFLEVVRSLGAALGDRSFVASGVKRVPNVEVLIGSRGCKGLQPSKSITAIDFCLLNSCNSCNS
jgi:hypothetical protein